MKWTGYLFMAIIVVACVFSQKENVMPSSAEIAQIMAKDNPSPQEMQKLRDWVSNVDNTTKRFSGTGDLEIAKLRADSADFLYAPLEAAKLNTGYHQINTSLTTITWTTEEVNNGVVSWSSSDPTKVYFPRGGIADRMFIMYMVMNNQGANSRSLQCRFTIYNTDDSLDSVGYFWNGETSKSKAASYPVTMDADDSYMIFEALSSTQDNFLFRFTIVRVR
jgi:hypothetical protein